MYIYCHATDAYVPSSDFSQSSMTLTQQANYSKTCSFCSTLFTTVITMVYVISYCIKLFYNGTVLTICNENILFVNCCCRNGNISDIIYDIHGNGQGSVERSTEKAFGNDLYMTGLDWHAMEGGINWSASVSNRNYWIHTISWAVPFPHYSDIIMSAIASQIISVSSVCLSVTMYLLQWKVLYFD